MTRFFYCFLVLCMLSVTMVGCSDDDDASRNGVTGDPAEYSSHITGLWYCTSQEWEEDGEISESKYTPSSLYSMRFDDDGLGYMTAGDDSLFEIMHSQTFRWSMRTIDDLIYLRIVDEYDENDYYKILYLKGDKLVLQWIDGDYSIKCEFVRNN